MRRLTLSIFGGNMTRKDYRIVADAISCSGLDEDAIVKLARSLSVAFLKDNDNFDPARFLDACVGGVSRR